MVEYDYVFCVLVYRNVMDIKSFVNSVNKKVPNSKVVIVNSYYDDKTTDDVKKCSIELGCDFINVDNKGYGYGNNKGIEYIYDKYMFRYLVISNPDIIIEGFLAEVDSLPKDKIIGPNIKTLDGKIQNPYWFLENHIGEFLLYIGFRYRLNVMKLIVFAINKIIRLMSVLWYKNTGKTMFDVYALHGSFIVFPYNLVRTMMPVFDEEMFLFNEEAYLAYKAKKRKIKMCINNKIRVLHKEDGSMKLSNYNESDLARKTFLHYFENR